MKYTGVVESGRLSSKRTSPNGKSSKRTNPKVSHFKKALAFGLAMVCSASAFALDINRTSGHLAENAAVGPYSYLDVGNLTNKTVRVLDIYYQTYGDMALEYTNTYGDGFTLEPGEWSRNCDDLALGYCYFKGAEFTNPGWAATYAWTSGNPRTNHYWKIEYQCEGDSKTYELKQEMHTDYWSEVVITDCANDEMQYTAISDNQSQTKAMEVFVENSPYNKVSDLFIESDFIDKDDPAWDGDYESWYGVTGAETNRGAVPDMNTLKGVSPVLVQCQTADGKTARELGLVMAENSIAKGCYCNNDDQPDGKTCPDLGVVTYWKIPDNLLGKIDPVGVIDGRVEKSLHQHKLMQVLTSNISGGDDLKEGTQLSVHVKKDGIAVSDPATYVVLADRQNQWTYALDFAKAVNSQFDVPVSMGERFADGAIVERGSSYRNWIWGKEDYDVSIERADPEYIDVLRGGHLRKGSMVNLEISNPTTGEVYRFDYIVPSDSAGKNWRWPAYFGKAINAEAAEKNYPVRVGEYNSSGKVATIGSSYRNKIYIGTNEPGNWSVRIDIHAK